MRLIDLGVMTPEQSVLVEKVLLDSYNGTDTLFFYSRDRPCVSVGRFGSIEDTVNSEYVRDNDIAVVRRISGGSSIYSDENQITYSLIASKSGPMGSRNDSFGAVGNAVTLSLMSLGVRGEFKPPNDVLVNGKKISGSAEVRTKNAVLHHGSIILDVDNERVSSALTDTKERSYDGLTSVKECIGRIPSRDEMAGALTYGFSGIFGNVRKGKLTKEEAECLNGSGLLLV
ncbi:MAG: lipoate--protein ligase family protein [Methanomassiliicoccaceae archaeon]|nr:lipoate--protein ligase family protein [Methanomassiliicoccaceae archaeon]